MQNTYKGVMTALTRTFVTCKSRYLIEKQGWDPDKAIAAFDLARGHKQERENYLDHLKHKRWRPPLALRGLVRVSLRRRGGETERSIWTSWTSSGCWTSRVSIFHLKLPLPIPPPPKILHLRNLQVLLNLSFIFSP